MYPGAHAKVDPRRPAVIMAESGQRLTYGELEERSVRLAHVLHEAGLRAGDTVALVTDNAVQAYEVYWAAMRSGMYLTAVNSHLSVGEIAYVVADSRAVGLVVSAALSDIAQGLRDESFPAVRTRLAYGGAVEGYREYEACLAEASPHPFDDQPLGADLLYSSGTTGRPKGIRIAPPRRQVHEEGDLLAALLRDGFGFSAETVYLSPAPVYHAAPLRFAARTHMLGGTVVMMERFDAEKALWAIERYGVTHSQWVPTMFVRMLKLDESVRTAYDLATHQVAIHAAAPCPVEVKRAMIDWWGPVLWEYYGSTEGIGMTLIDSAQWLEKPGSVGVAVSGTVRICAEDGRELPAGEIGTVYFECEELTFEYLGDPDKTRSTRHPEHANWATIGDVGYVDEDGYLYLTDRKAFMIISGGVNIYPAEIENVLTPHPEVLDAAVIGIPDAEMGESVKAIVQPTAHALPGPDLERELLEYVRARIARYKVPRSIDFVEQLPRTPVGKLVKGTLKEQYAEPARQ